MKKLKIFELIIIFVVIVILNLVVINLYSKSKNKYIRFTNGLEILNNNIQKTSLLKEELKLYENIIIEENNKFIIEDYVENLLKKCGIKNKVLYFKPVKNLTQDMFEESQYEIKIEDISIDELIKFIYEIEFVKKIMLIQEMKLLNNNKLKNKFDVIITLKYIKKNN